MLSMSMHVEGLDKLHDKLERISPSRAGEAWSRRALMTCAERVQAIAAGEMIIRGGRIGKGRRKTDALPDPTRLTSRTGRLRGSIRVNRSPLPRAIEVGTDVVYGAVHELIGVGRKRTKRPFMAPALEKAAKEFTRIFAKELGRELAK
jgi:phage gpG-like protein